MGDFRDYYNSRSSRPFHPDYDRYPRYHKSHDAGKVRQLREEQGNIRDERHELNLEIKALKQEERLRRRYGERSDPGLSEAISNLKERDRELKLVQKDIQKQIREYSNGGAQHHNRPHPYENGTYRYQRNIESLNRDFNRLGGQHGNPLNTVGRILEDIGRIVQNTEKFNHSAAHNRPDPYPRAPRYEPHHDYRESRPGRHDFGSFDDGNGWGTRRYFNRESFPSDEYGTNPADSQRLPERLRGSSAIFSRDFSLFQ